MYFSRTHYQRLFHAVVGEPVMEYIKKRRLQLACRALGESTATVLEVAVAHGYDSYEGFSRAFKAYFGMSPSQYRRVRTGIDKEEFCMLSENLKNDAARHIGEIVQALEPITAECNALAQAAEAVGKATGKIGATTLILAAEYAELARRMAASAQYLQQNLQEKEQTTTQTIFDMTDTVEMYMKILDDCTFQFNVLCLFSSVETARIANPVPQALADVDKKLEALTRRVAETRTKTIYPLLDALLALIQAEIESDAANQNSQAVALLQKTASDGMVLAADLKSAALSLGENGHAFMHIAKDVEKRVEAVKHAANAIRDYNGDRKPVDDAIKNMEDATFLTNISAFNAKIETARSGFIESLKACTERVLQLPQQMYEACRTGQDLFNESVRLAKLMRQSRERKEIPAEQQYQKDMEDILFQSGILFSQMLLEAERCKGDGFRQIAKDGGVAQAALTRTRDKAGVAAYRNALTEIIGSLEKEIAQAGEHGQAHKVFLQELVYFNKRIGALQT
jgi:AraC-like DNA-binding protein